MGSNVSTKDQKRTEGLSFPSRKPQNKESLKGRCSWYGPCPVFSLFTYMIYLVVYSIFDTKTPGGHTQSQEGLVWDSVPELTFKK